MRRFDKLRKVYVALALIVFNTLIVAVPALWLYRQLTPQGLVKTRPDTFEPAKLRPLFPDWSEGELGRLMDETWRRPFVYEPYLEFRERSFAGRHVNVSPEGYRHVPGGGAWPPSKDTYNIFVFGGSTTFGYGVADGQTIPAQLQRLCEAGAGGDKPIRVYNLGRGFYCSAQERALFTELLLAGVRPDVAVFIDGFNEFEVPVGSSKYQLQLTYLMDKLQAGDMHDPRELAAVGSLSAMRDSGYLRASDNEAAYKAMAERYLYNQQLIRMMGRAYGVRTVFVWQPALIYKYDVRHHLHYHPDPDHQSWRIYQPRAAGYTLAAAMRATGLFAQDLLWLADVQEGDRRPLYVDNVHYSPEFSAEIARAIFDHLIVSGHLVRR